MRSKDMALDYMERALRCLEEAELAFSKEDYAGTVRRSQEALELASKAILRVSGIEYPRENDVSPVLEAEKDRLPNPIIENLEAVIRLSSELASKAILRVSGIEYPRENDVSPVLEAEKDRLPNPIIENLEAIIRLSSELASLRGPAMYGYEREGIPAREAFKKDYSLEVLTEVKKLVEIMRKALYDIL